MFREQEETKLVDTYRLSAATNNTDEGNMDVQKVSVAKDTSGPSQCKPSHFSSSTKTNFIQYGLKICFENQDTLLLIIKCIPTLISLWGK